MLEDVSSYSKIVFVDSDIDPMNPREESDCHIGTIISLADRSFSGDKDAYDLRRNVKVRDDQGRFYYDAEDVEGSYILNCNELANYVGGRAMVLPIYMYSHSGDTIRTTPFGCRWDSGLCGYIYCFEDHAKEMGITNKAGKVNWKNVRESLIGEIKVLNQYMTGDVYGFRAFNVVDNELDESTEDSCWGFYGDDEKENGMEDHYGVPSVKE
jgi:hypothetical protein